MSIDQQLRDAGMRLAERPVEVPDLGGLLRHRHRVRSFAMSGAIVAFVAVVLIGVGAVGTPSDQPVADSGREPVTSDLIGLAATGGIWPNDALLEPTLEETAGAFATEVLGWSDATFATIRVASVENWVTVTSGDRSILLVATPTEGGWRLMRVGGGVVNSSVEASEMRLHLAGPPAAVAARWWAIADGVELTGTHTDLDRPLLLAPEARAVPSAWLVVFLDADGRAIDAVGLEGDVPLEGSETVPTYRLGLPGATLVRQESSFPAVGDMVVWAGTGERQPYLSLNLRLASSGVDMTPTGFGPMTEDPDFPGEAGRAWFTTDTSEEVGSMRMWWIRPDGSVWLLTAGWPHVDRGVPHADAVDQMRAWALAVEAPPSGDVADYELPVPEFERVAFDEGGTIRSRVHVWQYRNEEILLSISEEGVATQLSNVLALDEVERISVDGELGWRGIERDGRTVVSWQHPQHAVWATLLVPASLADDVDAMVAALERG